MKNKKVQFVTRTAVLLALCVVLQLVNLGQWVTGPAVNLILLLAAMSGGLPCGLTVAVLNPLLVFVIKNPPIMLACPAILVEVMLGNCVLVALAWALRKPLMGIPGLVAAAVGKGLAMFLLTGYVVLPLFGANLPDKLKMAAMASFGIIQMATAAIGAAVFFAVWQIVKKVPGFAAQEKQTEKN
ncbi:MAG: hypothetical protein LKJ90_02225 [Faecalibacterium sp.]|jgi:thiamine transporter ThiT|nr:hypothetical protein [Faecalibacterium sp.]